ncbi:MAG: arginase family protein [Pseudomonadota bacterium]
MAKITLIYAYWPNQPRGVTWCDLPWALREAGLPARLSQDGHEIVETMLASDSDYPEDLPSGFAMASDIAGEVRKATTQGELPIVLAGSCSMAALGAVGGLGSGLPNDAINETLGVAWFDAHPDLNTPETTATGLWEGMALAMIAGRAYRTLAEEAVGLSPVSLTHTALIGARDMDRAEQVTMADAKLTPVTTEDDLVSRLSNAHGAYVHFDMDVQDAAQVRTNSYAVPNGPSASDLKRLLASVPRVAAMSLTGLDPAVAQKDRAADLAIGYISTVANAWEPPTS